jgi:lysophospholipase L1-like esterase
MNTRRTFLKNAAVGAMAPSVIQQSFDKENGSNHQGKITLGNGGVLLFQGDSITDWGRDRKDMNPNTTNAIGGGYASYITGNLLLESPEKKLSIYNRGISGDKVFQLRDRWQTDTLDLKPDVISILVGVNDFWHTLDYNYVSTVEVYEKDLRALLTATKEKLPQVQFIIGEPFSLKGFKVTGERWYPAFDAYRAAARKVAAEFDAAFIPYQSIFDKALKIAPKEYWLMDGVHPTMAGAMLMCKEWLKMIKK